MCRMALIQNLAQSQISNKSSSPSKANVNLENDGIWVTKQSLGKSHENRDLNMLYISKRESDHNPTTHKPAVWLDCGIHARERITPATCLYAIGRLLGFVDKEMTPKFADLLDTFDFYVLPQHNPDGYNYARTVNNMWRKNRNPNTLVGSFEMAQEGDVLTKEQQFENIFLPEHLKVSGRPEGQACMGVDLNRNFDYRWGKLLAFDGKRGRFQSESGVERESHFI